MEQKHHHYKGLTYAEKMNMEIRQDNDMLAKHCRQKKRCIKCGLIILLFLCMFHFDSAAQFVFGAHVIKVVDLPNTTEYSVSTDQPFSSTIYCDLGIAHKQFSCVFPLWNYGKPEYVLYREKAPGEFSEADYFTHTLTDEEISYFHDLYGIPMTPEIPFWHKWGGKICFIIVTFLMIWIIDRIS